MNRTIKVKVQLSLCFNWTPLHESVLGSGVMAPRILDRGTRWRWVVSLTPRPLYPQGKNPWYPLDWRLGIPHSRSRNGGEEKNSQPLLGLEPPTIKPIAQDRTIKEQWRDFSVCLKWPVRIRSRSLASTSVDTVHNSILRLGMYLCSVCTIM
jgi:hypothetical protein